MIDVRDFSSPQTALDAVPGEGGAVYFPAGTYEIAAGLRPKSGTRLFGDGPSTRITCPAGGWALQPTTNFGLLNLNDVEEVVLAGLKIAGTKAADHTHTPKLIYLERARCITINDNILENSSFEGVWSGGDPSLTRTISLQNNLLRNIGYPAGSYGFLPAIQLNAEDCTISGNILTDVGVGIGASGARTVISGNRVSDIKLVGISVGDGMAPYGLSVVGNSIEVQGSPTHSRRAIYLCAGAVEPKSHLVLVQGNFCRLSAVAGDQAPRGVLSGTARQSAIIGNAVEIQGRGDGICILGSPEGVRAFISDNVIRVMDEIGMCSAINAIPNGGGKAVTVLSSGNRVFGIGGAHGSFAYDFNANGGGTLTAKMISDWCESGHVRMAQQYFGSGQMNGELINLAA